MGRPLARILFMVSEGAGWVRAMPSIAPSHASRLGDRRLRTVSATVIDGEFCWTERTVGSKRRTDAAMIKFVDESESGALAEVVGSSE